MTSIHVNAEVFDFYMRSYGLSVEELAQKANIAPDKVSVWHTQDSDIAISSLRDMANIYKKHWGIFMLKAPPTSFKKPRDYRARASHHHFGLVSRLAFEEANRLIELAASYSLNSIDENMSALASGTFTAPNLAIRVRKVLSVTEAIQYSWTRPEDAWNYYYEKLQSLGFVVSIQDLDEGIDGFIVIKDEGIAIVINRAVKSVYRRTFTLLHELGHYFQKVSAACNTYEVVHEVDAENYADDFATNLFVPSALFSSQPSVIEIAAGRTATDSDYEILAKKFCVSMSQVAVRLFRMQLITRGMLDKQLDTAERIYRQKEKIKRAKAIERGGFDPKGHERKAIGRVGKTLSASILDSYRSEKITAREFSSTMGVKINLVGRIEDMLDHER